LDPANADVARNAYYLSLTLGRLDEALRHAKAATELDPLNYNNYFRLGGAEFYAGNLAEAEASFRKALELRPDADGLHASIASVLLARGQRDAALAELEREPTALIRELNRPIFLESAGRKSEADRALALAETKYGKASPYSIGELYAARDNLDRAFAWWDRAYRAHDGGLGDIKMAPMDTMSKQLASDPRFKALLRKMNLPE
jgi:tetratricopeptide (TPR) repeat protein